MKKFLVVLVVLFIGILFAGCTSQTSTPATPTQTAVATPVATPVATAIPTTLITPNQTANVTANVSANVTANVTAVPTPVPEKLITFTPALTVTPDTTVYIPVGTKIVWYNADQLKPHGIQAIGTTTQKYFGVVNIPYGGFYNVTFDQKGVYEYSTLFQPQLSGKIVVS